MNKALKTLLGVFLVLTAVLSPVMAAAVSVNWQWNSNDPYIQYFRYQVGGEAEENWTVVSSDVTSYTFDEADPATEYTLYLQQSYDGIYWSDSARFVSVSPVTIPVYLPLLGNVEAEGGPGKVVITADRAIETTAGSIVITADGEGVTITYPYGYDKYAAAFVEVLEADYPGIMSNVTVTQSRSRLTAVYAEEITDQAVLDAYADALVAEIYARLSAGLYVEPVQGVVMGEEEDFILPPPPASAAAAEETSAPQEIAISNVSVKASSDFTGWYFGLAMRYQLPWFSWSTTDMASVPMSRYTSSYSRTVLSAFSIGYAPSETLRFGITGGIGVTKYRSSSAASKLSIVPFSFDVDWNFISAGNLRFIAGLSVGGYVRMNDSKFGNLGPQASVRLGAEYPVSEHVVLGITTGLSLLGTYTNGSALALELDYVPFIIGVRYHF